MGHYCPAGSSEMLPCPKGTYRNTIKGQDLAECGQCPAGTYCPNEGTSIPTDCDIGSFCPQASILPQLCPIGTYDTVGSLRDSRACTPCDTGYYCPRMGQVVVDTVNHECDAGYWCIGGSARPEPTDNTTGSICPIGRYCEQNTLTPTSCTPASYGPFIGAKAATDCSECLEGYYCPGDNAAEAIVECEARYYCPRGSAALDDGVVVESTPGHYAPTGSIIELECERGYY